VPGTIQEIADKVGVSRGTVDRALNNRGRVAPDVAMEIEKVAQEIGYVPKRVLRRAKGLKIGVITQLSKSSFMDKIRKGIEDMKRELELKNVTVIIEECEGVDAAQQLAAMERLEREGVSGLAIMPVDSIVIHDKLNELIGKEVKVVTFNSDIVGTGRACYVGLNNVASGRTAAGIMGYLTKGAGKVLAITGYFENNVNTMRLSGFVDVLRKEYPEINLVGVQGGFDDAKEVEKIVVNALEVHSELEGIVIFSGGQEGILRALSKFKLENRPYIIAYDLTEKNRKALDDGKIDFIIDQDGYTQGNQSLKLLSDMLLEHKVPKKEHYYTEIIIKTKFNI
jgi:LacI family transcriptional regulator